MRLDPLTKMLGLPPALLLLVASQLAAAQNPTAIRKMPPDSGAKFFPEYVAFHPDVSYEARVYPRNDERGYSPGFKLHVEDEGRGAFRRAAEVLGVLQRRESCPPSMAGCGKVGHPDKCCSEEEECVEVDNPGVGNVACCPQGIDCDGGVGACPPSAVTCPESLGGGCCIAGYMCKGTGCVRDTSSGDDDDESSGATTMTATSTAWVDGNPSTVVVTIVTTITNAAPTETRTTVKTETESETESDSPTTTKKTSSSGAGAPFRPTNGDDNPTATESFCPTGFYACVAHAGGCCQTGRDCETTSCPPVDMTTIVTQGVTIAVPVDDVPDEEATQTCAGGWFLCDGDDGDEEGCCPDGYKCGKESCTTVTPSETAEVQKLRPESAAGRAGAGAAGVLGCLGVFAALHLM